MPFTRPVTSENQRLLQRIYRQSCHHVVRQRAHCILLRSQGKRVSELVEIFAVSRKTIYNWLGGWETRSMAGLYDQAGRGRKPTFTPEQQEQIRQWSQEHPRQLKQVLQRIKEQWGIVVSHKTITRILKGLQMSWHHFRRVVGGQPDAQEYTEKQAQLEALQRLEARGEIDLYCLNETGFCLIPYIPYGWQGNQLVRVKRPSTAQQMALRARIMLLVADGANHRGLARTLNLSRDRVRLGRNRWLELSQKGMPVVERLAAAPRPGGLMTFSVEPLLQLFALAGEKPEDDGRPSEKPEDYGRPISPWRPRERTDAIVKQGLVTSISPRPVGRLLPPTQRRANGTWCWLTSTKRRPAFKRIFYSRCPL